MANTTIAFGVILILLGAGGYFGTGAVSPTALIPSAFGLVLLVLGVLARDPGKRKHAMHFAALVALLGVGGTVGALGDAFAVIGGREVARPAAAIAKASMAILMLVFLGLCVRSFIEARRSRSA